VLKEEAIKAKNVHLASSSTSLMGDKNPPGISSSRFPLRNENKENKKKLVFLM
jgi:hypothetical protein